MRTVETKVMHRNHLHCIVSEMKREHGRGILNYVVDDVGCVGYLVHELLRKN